METGEHKLLSVEQVLLQPWLPPPPPACLPFVLPSCPPASAPSETRAHCSLVISASPCRVLAACSQQWGRVPSDCGLGT